MRSRCGLERRLHLPLTWNALVACVHHAFHSVRLSLNEHYSQLHRPLTCHPTPIPRPQLLDTHAVGVRREKMYKLDDHVACAVAGITADANILINHCRLAAQRYLFAYGEPIPVEQLVRAVCDTKQVTGCLDFSGQRVNRYLCS